MPRRLPILFFWGITVFAIQVMSNERSSKEEIFALIIGANNSLDSKRSPLRFADDDAYQNWQLMTQLAKKENIIVLTVPDKETRVLYADVPSGAPTRENMDAGMAILNARMKRAKRSGRVPIFYLFYTGHGDVKNNEGYVSLASGRFSRGDLLDLLERSVAAQNHVVIDACKSYFMVYPRGTGKRRRPVSGSFISKSRTLPDNTGFFLSTSSGGDSHEWEAYQGGIFSHEMRSALRGAADIDGDQMITYEEAAAFVWRANTAIPVERFRPAFFVRPPGDAAADQSILADLSQATGTWLRLGTRRPEHQYLEDGMGRRLLDIHPAPQVAAVILLPQRRPLFVRFPRSGREIRLPSGDVIDIGETPATPWQVGARGAEHESFALLFSKPFDVDTVNAYRRWAEVAKPVQVDTRDTTWIRRGFGIGGLVVGAVGATMTGLALRQNRGIDGSSSGKAIYDADQKIAAYNNGAVACYSLAGAALTTYIVWRLWPKRSIRVAAVPGKASMLWMGGVF